MKFAKYTHKAFDGVKSIKGWVLVNNYGEKEFVEIIVNSDGKTTTVALEIPNQSFCLEITVKPKEEVQDDSKI